LKEYKFHVPCHTKLVVIVEAKSVRAAWAKVKRREYKVLWEFEGATESGVEELVSVRNINKGDSK
jgi:hypothetical protein